MTDASPTLEELQGRLGQTEPIFAVFIKSHVKPLPEGRGIEAARLALDTLV